MPVSAQVTKIEKTHAGVGDSATVTVHIKVHTQGLHDLNLAIEVPSQPLDRVLIETTNRVIHFAEELQKAVQNGGLHF